MRREVSRWIVKWSVGVALASLLLATPSFAGVLKLKCGLHSHLIEILQKSESTTDLREEQKWHVTALKADSFEELIKSKFGQYLTQRDPIPEGRVNITSSDYSTVMKYPGPDGKMLSAKLRIRHYGTRVAGTNDFIEPSGFYDEISKVELKADHPTESGVKYKASVLMNNGDIALLLKNAESFTQNAPKIRARALALNAEKGPKLGGAPPDVVNELINVIGRIHLEKSQRGAKENSTLDPYLNIQYQRKAYRLTLPDKTRPDGPGIDVQVVFDKGVQSRDPATPYVVKNRIAKDVVEVKVPLEYSKLTPEQLAERSPELAELNKLLEPTLGPAIADGKYTALEGSATKQAAREFIVKTKKFWADRSKKWAASQLLTLVALGIYKFYDDKQQKDEKEKKRKLWKQAREQIDEAIRMLEELADGNSEETWEMQLEPVSAILEDAIGADYLKKMDPRTGKLWNEMATERVREYSDAKIRLLTLYKTSKDQKQIEQARDRFLAALIDKMVFRLSYGVALSDEIEGDLALVGRYDSNLRVAYSAALRSYASDLRAMKKHLDSEFGILQQGE